MKVNANLYQMAVGHTTLTEKVSVSVSLHWVLCVFL